MKLPKNSKGSASDGGARVAATANGSASKAVAQPRSKLIVSPPTWPSSQAKLKVKASQPSPSLRKDPAHRMAGLVATFSRTAVGATQGPACSASKLVPKAPTRVSATVTRESNHPVPKGPRHAAPLPVRTGTCEALAVNPLVELMAEVKALRQALELIAQVLSSTRQPRAAGRALAGRTVNAAGLAELAGKKLLDIRQVEQLVGAKRSTIYGWMKAEKFVMPVRTSPKASRWIASEVEAWLDSHKATRDSAPSSACSTTPAVETGRIANFT